MARRPPSFPMDTFRVLTISWHNFEVLSGQPPSFTMGTFQKCVLGVQKVSRLVLAPPGMHMVTMNRLTSIVTKPELTSQSMCSSVDDNKDTDFIVKTCF